MKIIRKSPETKKNYRCYLCDGEMAEYRFDIDGKLYCSTCIGAIVSKHINRPSLLTRFFNLLNGRKKEHGTRV